VWSGANAEGEFPLWGIMDDVAKEQQKEQEKATKAWESAAKKTEKEMTSAAEKMAKEFESRLLQIEGLFGTTSVTAEDMTSAAGGYYTEKPDEWLRQLADEVVNKVDRPGVDIEDAKARAGLSASVPAEAALAMIQQMWADSSLFAGGKNLDLINKTAVDAALARQDASASGRDAIMALFGMGGTGAKGEKGEPTGAATDATNMITQISTQIETEEVTKQLGGIGANLANGIHSGFVTEVDSLDWRGPIVNRIASDVTALVAENLSNSVEK
jgi:hypothetical protein